MDKFNELYKHINSEIHFYKRQLTIELEKTDKDVFNSFRDKLSILQSVYDRAKKIKNKTIS
jgi:hypothetical protein